MDTLGTLASKLRCVFCIPSVSRAGGGVSEAARLQALTLSDAGLDICIEAMDDPFVAEDVPNWREIEVATHRVHGPRSYAFAPFMVSSLFSRRADIVHVHGVWQFQCLATWLWSFVTGKPYVVTPHGMLEKWIRRRSPKLKWLVSRIYQNSFLKRSAGFQILTEKEREDIAEFVRDQPVRVIPNYVSPFETDGVDPPWWRPEFTGRSIHLFLGRIHEKKGCIELCEAWRRRCEAEAAFRVASVLVFCGWIDGLKDFQALVKGINAIHGNIIFAGPQYGLDKQRSLARAHFFHLPSKSEGLPMAVLEAWSAGVPVIMTEECNLPRGFERAAAIQTWPDINSIEATLAHCAAMDETTWQAHSAAAQKLVLEDYSMDAVREALVDFYETAIAFKKDVSRVGRQGRALRFRSG